MPSHSLSNLVQDRLSVGGETSEHVALVLPWVSGTGLDTVVALLRRTALTREGAGDVQVKLAIQTAAVRTTDPDDWTGLGSWYSNDGVDCTGSVDVSSYTAGKLHVRFAIMYRASASTLSAGEVCAALQVAWCSLGRVVGGRTTTLTTSTSTDFYETFTDWIPYAWVDEVKMGLIVTDRQGNLQVQVAYQTAEAEVEDMDAWANVPGSSAQSSDGEWCTGELDLQATGKMWIRFGLRYQATSGSASATVTLITTVR